MLRKHYSYVASRFADARLRAAFSFQDMYIGVSPFDAPSTFSLLQYTEFCDGMCVCVYIHTQTDTQTHTHTHTHTYIHASVSAYIHMLI